MNKFNVDICSVDMVLPTKCNLFISDCAVD